MGLGSVRRRGNRGVENGAALRGTSAARCAMNRRMSSGDTLVSHWGRPHVRLANAEGPFGHKHSPLRVILREGRSFGEGGPK